MLCRRFLVIVLLSAAMVAAAAVGDIADLESELVGSSGSARLKLLNLLAAACNNQDALKQIQYGREALALSRRLHDRNQEAQALFYMGGGYLDRNESQDAISAYGQAEKLFNELHLTTRQFDCIKNIGSVYENMGDFAKAQAYYEQALTLARRTGFEKGMAVAISYIGIIHVYQSEPDKALACFLQALAIQEKLGDPAHIANTKSYIGTVYADLGNHEKALDYYKQSLAVYRKKQDLANIAITLSNIGLEYGHLKKPQEALAAYNEALPLSEKVGDKNNVGRVLDSMAGTYVDLKDFERALQLYTKSLDIWRETGSPYMISSTTTNIGELYIHRRDYPTARHYIDESLLLAKQAKDKGLQQVNYHNLAEVLEAMGNFRDAFVAFKKSVEIKEQIVNEEKNRAIAEMETKYDAEKKRKQIELLSKDNEIQKLQLSRARFRSGALLSGIALLLIVFFLLFRRYLHLLAFWKKKTYISHYKLERQIGSGAMGTVWQASDLTGDKKSVALKLIREEHASDPVQRKRFLNEAYLVDQLNHPNIIKVFERGEYQHTLFIAMELLTGRSLADAIRAGERLSLAECQHIMKQLAGALAGIHGQGILHRDVKPANIMMSDGRSALRTVKLLDFGLAQSSSLTRLTETGEILGTVYYMAPELISQRQASAASDIYALGVVFYELLTLEKPFLGENPGEIIRAILESEPIAPDHFRRDLSIEQSALVLRMLSKDPTRRPADDEMLAAFACET